VAKSPQAANQLAKVSNDISIIYTDVFVSGLMSHSIEADVPEPAVPAFPPGLFASIEEAEEFGVDAGTRHFIEDEMFCRFPTPSASKFLEPIQGETIVESFERILGPWGRARFRDLLESDRELGHELAAILSRIKAQMAGWDTELLQLTLTDHPNGADRPDGANPSQPGGLACKARHGSTVADATNGVLREKCANRGQTQEVATWAKVAAGPSTASSDGRRQAVARTTAGLDHSGERKEAAPCNDPDQPEPAYKQQRVVYVRGLKRNSGLRHVTRKISLGPLVSLWIHDDGPDTRTACVVFQLAEHARQFLSDNAAETERAGHGVYGPGSYVQPGGPWLEDDDIRSMSLVQRERRRLTFSGPQIFAHVSREKFRQDIVGVAGEANVELIWLFNTGNATVVFSSVSPFRHGPSGAALTCRRCEWRDGSSRHSASPGPRIVRTGALSSSSLRTLARSRSASSRRW
jgi:hypothetical protein